MKKGECVRLAILLEVAAIAQENFWMRLCQLEEELGCELGLGGDTDDDDLRSSWDVDRLLDRRDEMLGEDAG